MTEPIDLQLGAWYLGRDRCRFRVWAPRHETVQLSLVAPRKRLLPMRLIADGYHEVTADGIPPGARYFYRLDAGLDRPDPASRFQPGGVHDASAVVDPAFDWEDPQWRGLSLRDYVIYESHVGTFTPEGTFDAIIARLEDLRDLGVTAIELMPVAQFPGDRNWGYDGVYPFAAQHSYGGPAGLKRLINSAHQRGLAVILDVVYNHLGPEGNYLGQFAPYFTRRYRTAWGEALNFDGAESHHVRRFFIENALMWQTEYHVDALRLDAVHAIRDFSAVPFLEELAETCHAQSESLNRRFHLIAESDMNMARHILPRELGGYGLDAQWSDDFHHALHALLTGERNGYYADYGSLEQLAKVFREGYAYTGEISRHRRRRHGSSPRRNPAEQFVVCVQNHDQVGNRMLGDRLSATLDFEQLKLAAGALLLAPFVPLLFMGEEYAETAPFQYFTSHSDPGLVEAVRQGRQAEFASFRWQGDVPDPQSMTTFDRCRLHWDLARQGHHRVLRDFYRALLRLRRDTPALATAAKETMRVRAWETERVLGVHYPGQLEDAAVLFSFSDKPATLPEWLPRGRWRKQLDSTETQWNGPGSACADAHPADETSRWNLPARAVSLWTIPRE